MKIETLSAIVAYSGLLLVQGLDSTVSNANGMVDSSRRILNGRVANPEYFSFIVLMIRPMRYTQKVCGGSVISNHFILTAAHCIFNYPCTELEIYTSSWAPGDIPIIHAARCLLHEEFIPHQFDFDIGLVKTRENLVRDLMLLPIPMAAPGTIYVPGDLAIIAGWGIVQDGSYPRHLMYAVVPIYSWRLCNLLYTSADICSEDMICPVAEIPDHALCMQGSNPSFPSPCVGDFGGPVMTDGLLAGVMTAVVLTPDLHCNIESPALNMDVAKFVPWILNFTQFDGAKYQLRVDEEFS